MFYLLFLLINNSAFQFSKNSHLFFVLAYSLNDTDRRLLLFDHSQFSHSRRSSPHPTNNCIIQPKADFEGRVSFIFVAGNKGSLRIRVNYLMFLARFIE